MTTLYCAECEDRFEADDDHVELTPKIRRMDDRDERDHFLLCVDCWHELSAEWIDPV